VREIVPWPLRGLANVFVGAPGTRFPTLFASGRLHYRCFVLRKAVPAPALGDSLPHADTAMPAFA
jgi:hypothetical protein